MGVVLSLPALAGGFFMDDLVHQIMLRPDWRERGFSRGDWDMFVIQAVDPGHYRAQLDMGTFPWWTPPEFRLAFLRPLTSVLHAFDYRHFVRWPALIHAESLLFYALAIFFAALVYRRFMAPGWAAGLAAVLYAIDDAHAMPIAWIANRNALIAAAAGFATLLLHERARRADHRLSAVLAAAVFAVGLAAGEAAVATLAYLGAYALWIDRAPAQKRALSLAPYAAVVVVWTAIYRHYGFGAAAGAFYIDPGSDPAAFTKAVATRWPLLALGQLLGPPPDAFNLVTNDRMPGVAAVVALVLVPIVVLLARALWHDRVARFFATGMALSLVPVCGTWPNDRLLTFSGLGGFGLVALFLASRRVEAGRAARAAASVLAALFVLFHAIAAPILLPLRIHMVGDLFRGYIERGEGTLPPSVPGTESQTVVVVNAPDVLVVPYSAVRRTLRGGAIAGHLRLLAVAIEGNDGELARLDEHTVAVTLRRGLLHDSMSQLYRASTIPFRAGDVVALSDVRIEVVEVTADGRPKRVHFRFDRSLDDPSLIWMTWDGPGFVPVKPPPVGGRVPIPAIDYLEALGG